MLMAGDSTVTSFNTITNAGTTFQVFVSDPSSNIQLIITNTSTTRTLYIYDLVTTTFTCPTIASTITVNPASTLVAGSVYNTISAAVADISGCGITRPAVIELSNNYVGTGESFPITLRAVSGMSSTNTIRPETGATVNLSANVPTNPIFSINGGTYWNIDGRAGGAGTTKSLTIENISTSLLSPGILLINGAQYNTITYCNIKSASTSTTFAGTVAFSTSTASIGNSFNTVSYCNISDASTGTSTSSITSSPTGTSLADARFNNNNTITYNNIYNFYNATSTSYLGAGIVLTNGYNSDWTAPKKLDTIWGYFYRQKNQLCCGS
jgi:hypothetical protein